ncbi:MAG: hypothetical protein QM760_03270 [Nibricoccus sp.]
MSSLLGQINDFAGQPPPPPPPPGPMEMKAAKSSAKTAAAPVATTDVAKLLASNQYVLPVSIVGSQAQRGPYLPGVKDLLIAVTFLRMAEQITDAGLKVGAQKFAYDLMAKGNAVLADHVSSQRAILKKK